MELKTCPFCGCKAGFVILQNHFHFGDRFYRVQCNSKRCGCMSFLHTEKEKAAKVWNNRTDRRD